MQNATKALFPVALALAVSFAACRQTESHTSVYTPADGTPVTAAEPSETPNSAPDNAMDRTHVVKTTEVHTESKTTEQGANETASIQDRIGAKLDQIGQKIDDLKARQDVEQAGEKTSAFFARRRDDARMTFDTLRREGSQAASTTAETTQKAWQSLETKVDTLWNDLTNRNGNAKVTTHSTTTTTTRH